MKEEREISATVKREKGIIPRQPIWIRLPKPGQECPWTSITRSTMNDIILAPDSAVKSLSLKKHKGANRGIRIIHLQSLLDYLDSLAAKDLAARASAVVEDDY